MKFLPVLLILLVAPGLLGAYALILEKEKAHPKAHPDAQAQIEVGIDSNSRRIFRPRLRFTFPLFKGDLYAEMDYLQRINRDLKGEVDFWLNAGYIRPVNDTLYFEGIIRHFCRHITSVQHSRIMDVNEIAAKIFYRKPMFTLGFGAGGYLRDSEPYDSLLLMSIELPRMLNSEFSLTGELKILDLDKILPSFELSCALNQNIDLFIRYTQEYGYRPMTYTGLRLVSQDEPDHYIKKLAFRAGANAVYNHYKVAANHEVRIEFMGDLERRLLLYLDAYIPIHNTSDFFGPFRPDKILYPFVMEYERKTALGVFLSGYLRYEINMPVDIKEEFSSNLGIGLGIKNQPDFSRLNKNIRFQIFAGKNFAHKYDLQTWVGLNTTQDPVDIGVDLKIRTNWEQTVSGLELFVLFEEKVNIRPFIMIQQSTFPRDGRSQDTRISIGLELIKWY